MNLELILVIGIPLVILIFVLVPILKWDLVDKKLIIKEQEEQERQRLKEIEEQEKAKLEIENQYKCLSNESGLDNILGHNIEFNVRYMNNDDAYNYYNENKELFSNLQKFLSNNKLLIKTSNNYNYHLQDEIGKQCDEKIKYLDILSKGDDEKELFDIRINGYFGVVKGVKAELEISELLTKYFPSMHAIGSVNLSFGENDQYHDFENDAILVGKKGIFTIEIKNKTYKVYENGYYEKKLIIYSDGSSSEKDSDLIKQSVEHANLLEVFLTKKFPNIEFLDTIHEIMVIMNEEVEIVNQAPDLYNVVKPAGLRAAINKYPVCLTDEEVKQIIQVLEDNKKEAKKYPFLTVNAPQLDELMVQQQKLMDAFYEKGYLKNE